LLNNYLIATAERWPIIIINLLKLPEKFNSIQSLFINVLSKELNGLLEKQHGTQTQINKDIKQNTNETNKK
jgi:hypothetical protein